MAQYQDRYTKMILSMSDVDIMKLEIITERVVVQLDKIEKLTDKEENLVQVALIMAWREFIKNE